MKAIICLLVLSAAFLATHSKGVSKTIKVSNFNNQGPFIFLTKFRMGAGVGQMDMSYKKGEQIISETLYNDISIGMVNETFYSQFSSASTCQEKTRYIFKRQKMNFKQERYGMKHVKIFDLEGQQSWYFYMYSCVGHLPELANKTEQVELSFTVTTNGSQFAQNEFILYFYIILVVVWITLIIKFALPMGTLLTFKKPDALKMTIFGGLLMLGMAYLYRFIHLVLVAYDGLGVHFFQIAYIVLKNSGQAMISTMIISLSWGWSILHLKSGRFYFALGVLVGIINIVSLALSSLTEQHEELYHQYQTTPGVIVLVLRILLFVVFIMGIFQSLNQATSKIVFFIKKIAVVGSLYLLSWPVTVFVVQLTFPSYMYKEVITFVEEIVHVWATTLLCKMISEPESAYRKVSLQEDDNPFKINDYHKR